MVSRPARRHSRLCLFKFVILFAVLQFSFLTIQLQTSKVRRTDKGGSLPVYATYKNANTRVVTVLRNIDGDIPVRFQLGVKFMKKIVSSFFLNPPLSHLDSSSGAWESVRLACFTVPWAAPSQRFSRPGGPRLACRPWLLNLASLCR